MYFYIDFINSNIIIMKKYFVLDIKGGTHNKYGAIAMIYANPVMENVTPSGRISYSVIDHYSNDTETFVIPEDMNIIQSIVNELQCNRGVWEADLDKFIDEDTFNETLHRRVKAHLYKYLVM